MPNNALPATTQVPNNATLKLIPKYTFILFQEECYFNCTLVFNEWGRRVVKDLSCMENCFEERSCFSSLLKDIIRRGVCTKHEVYPYPNSDSCDVTYNMSDDDNVNIRRGTCSFITEIKLKRKSCFKRLLQQRHFVFHTIMDLIKSSCRFPIWKEFKTFVRKNKIGRKIVQ